VKRGFVPGADFTFQSSQLGGRLQKGGFVVDFLFTRPAHIAFSVLGIYFHYEKDGGTRTRDLLGRLALAGQGVTVIFLDEDDVLDDVEFYVGEGLELRDHSRLASE